MKDVIIIIYKNIFKFIISSALVIAMMFSSIPVYSQDITNITLLGDSITTGYGLSDDEIAYGDYLKNYFKADVDNFAVNGLKTEELIEQLKDDEIISSIENSELICISIGGNDFLSIFQTAISEIGGGSVSSNGQPTINISSDFISKFVMDYSSAFSNAAILAEQNIATITSMITNINPNAEFIMQTVYNPFDSSNEEMKQLMAPLKTFTSMYMTTINNSIKENAPYTADISLKFSEKPYLYTNIDSYDIHPNYIGHLLIAEEIIQTLAETGDFSAFTDTIFNLPQGIYAEFPQYTADELDLFAHNQLRRGTLEQSVRRTTSASVQESATETESTENTTEITDITNDTKKDKSKKILSKVFMIIGFSIIILVTFLKFVRERKKNR